MFADKFFLVSNMNREAGFTKQSSIIKIIRNWNYRFRTVSLDGYGYSKGIDLYFCDNVLWKNFEYRLSYSYNLSKRKYREYTELTVPQYATRHHASLVLKYSVPRLRTIFSVTDGVASGRPYHNPELSGLMNDEVKPYHSLDLGITVLAGKK